MNKTKRVLSVVLAVLMLSSLIAALAIADEMYTVVINYIFEDNSKAAPEWVGTIYKGSALKKDVKSPEIVGYTPDKAVVSFNITAADHNVTETVTYKPAVVNYTVKHYQQNVDNDNYVLVATETKTGLTNSLISDNLKKKYDGFTALNYNTDVKIAADGSTIVEIKYDRNYYMLSLNLDGGYGVEPIYARYGAPVKVENPTKPGYTFNGWDPAVPTTVPAENTTYKAKWQAEKNAKVSVVFWYENADDNGYSYMDSVVKDVTVNSSINSGNYQNENFTGRDNAHFTYNAAKAETVTVKADGSTVLNVYFKRNTYTLTFRELTCDKWFFHEHSDKCYTTRATITAKYNARISDKFSKAPFNTTYNGRAWECTDSSKFNYALQTLDRMPGFNATFNLYDKNSNVKKTIYYYVQKVGITVSSASWPTSTTNFDLMKQVDTYFNYATYNEEYHEIQGFTRYARDVADFDENNTKQFVNNRLNLYYLRDSYELEFKNSPTNTVDKKTVQYEAELAQYAFDVPYPAGLEPNAYYFDGWYLNPECTGDEYKLEEHTMPAGNLLLYAKWAPKTHTVKTFLTKEKIEENDPIDTWDNVPHGTAVTNTPADPQNGSYVFVGWFYMDGNVEKAFDFSMPIVKDLNLYAKWSSNTLVTYTIYYKSGDTEIAEPTTGSALAGTTLTFEAKTGDELNEDYQSGYFPHTGSHSLTMDINGNNEFTFVYVAKEKVGYTVRYLDKATGEPVVVNGVSTPDKTGETSDAIITEKFVQISGYAPDAYQKRLVLSATEAENVITFWYTKDDVHAPVQIVHWTQNIAGEGYTEYQSSTNLNGEIGQTYTGTPLTIPGFTYNPNPANAHTEHPALASGVLTAEGLELNLYYDRNMYDYVVKHVDADDNSVIKEEAVQQARFGAQVYGTVDKTLEGYMPIENQDETKTLIIGTGTNKIVFMYYKCYYIGHVQSGSLNNTDTIRLTGSPENLTARVPQGYLYGGAFTNEACDADHVQTFTQGENAINFTPVKGETYYIWEVSETYLKPRTYALWRHDPTVNGTLNVVGLYIMTHADRLYYQSVGFEIVGENATFANREVYQVVNAKKGDILYQQIYVNLQGEMAVSDTEVDATNRKAGYIAMYKLSEGQFATFVDKGLTFQPYWVTLDGIIVRGVNSRECGYKGPGQTDITVNNKDRIGSSVSNFATPSQQTVEAVSYYAFEAADVEVATPDVPVTPEIPEVPEAPDMTLNSDAMYLRAQYTYEMMTNTVKFISAIDVNECTEYGFVINGEVVKCEEAAETVDGYDANYLFGGSVNGAMLMSCNVLLDGLVDGMTLNVTPYYVALDGTTVVYGEARTLVYRQWVGLEG